ncbi:MAG: single-stranded-DNA-specific exonuclease RecJ [Trueperaceae bacterium]
MHWCARPLAPPDVVDRLMRTHGVPPVLASMLWARGFAGPGSERALHPPLEPSPIPGLDAAAERLDDAIARGRRILIHGDYDADGITGTAVLLLGLRALGANVEPFLPNRLTHGYGVHADLVPQHAAGCDLFVTVDCGITNVAEVRALRRAGVEVIVTDHHAPDAELPDALVVHPRLGGPDGPTPQAVGEPTGAGVAYHLIWRLHQRRGIEAPLALSDLAASGTVADVAPLLGENRALVREGLARLQDSAWPGVRAMVAQARLRGAPTARDLAFLLAPRLNASGRLGEPEVGLDLLTTASDRKARELAAYLDTRNDERKRLQETIYQAADAQVDPDAPAIVVHDDAWHPGVMGIVASKLLERWYKPVFIVARGQGSVRSTPGLSAVQALRAASDALLRFGGHEAAAGFAIDPARLDAFRDRIYAHVAAFPAPRPQVTLDALLDPTQIDEDLWRAVQAMEPFGEGHPAPTFALSERLSAVRAVGRDGAHLQLRVGDVKGVAWRKGHLSRELRPGSAVQVAAALTENRWNDRRTLEFVAEEIRAGVPLPLGDDPVHAGPDAGPDAETDAETDADTTAEAARAPSDAAHVRRGPPPPGTAATDEAHIRTVPLSDDPHEAHRPLARRLRDGAPLWLDLDATELARLADAARAFPTVHDLRRAYVALRGGRSPRLPPAADRNVRRALRELELLDGDGAVRTGGRTDPYASDTLRAGLLQRYRIESLRNAYLHLDDDGFARTVRTLYASGARD